ncbi:hypothetical protein C9I98_18210 [Photobacterium sanctipauli]|uniref:Uncharacterized protein n=1 Tax=Photobacterium sanctipauli TaxID=1342794 RepID=A0A2T3NP37_9GAMM|nr:magnetosome protein MamC [Photobacterium sanctipauli]PSW18029.1 hypothetical protein C9I98_18210 [Photobacterium sanctipauli]
MTNSTNKLNPASRAMIAGAIIGGTASAASQWKSHQQGELETNQMVTKVTTDALKTGLASGAATYVADKMAGRPVLSMLTVLSTGAVGLYLMDQYAEKKKHG